jgi:hypothetical protein
MDSPDWLFVPGVLAAMGQQCVLRAGEFGFDEEVAKGGVRGIGGSRGQYYFGIAGDFDLAVAGRIIGE